MVSTLSNHHDNISLMALKKVAETPLFKPKEPSTYAYTAIPSFPPPYSAASRFFARF
jgi:hypothetical protein